VEVIAPPLVDHAEQHPAFHVGHPLPEHSTAVLVRVADGLQSLGLDRVDGRMPVPPDRRDRLENERLFEALKRIL